MPALFTLNYARVQFFLLDNLAQPVLTPEQAGPLMDALAARFEKKQLAAKQAKEEESR